MMKNALIVGALALSACAQYPGPSVPLQPGQNSTNARAAVQTCSAYARQGGRDALAGGYVAGVLLGGIVVGPVVVAANQRGIRADGEAQAVDQCLGELGYVRRDLTPRELHALNTAGVNRRALLDHLVAGGTVETFHSR